MSLSNSTRVGEINPQIPGDVDRPGAPFWFLLLALVFLMTFVSTQVQADPQYDGPLLYGLDPVLGATDDPRLIGIDRLVLKEHLLFLGVDPFKHPGRKPGLESSFRKIWNDKTRLDFDRTERLVEYNGPLKTMTVIEYPSWYILFPAMETLPGGFVYNPPRNIDNQVVKVFVDELDSGLNRKLEVSLVGVRNEALNVAGGGRNTDHNDGLINLTIPIKLPRTLEKIIGRGEKTRIKISGREHLAISGESSVTKPFVGSERVSSQSLFPTLNMEQQLSVNLSGTIGEKIIIEVDHNSAAMGPDATKIKLMYQGLEDEIIRTIETGDVGLTLPGSQLLGYSSNKSGLFGIKVTGQLGPADFTVVASKQKAEASSKTFNSKGGQQEEFIIDSSRYLDNRFFRLDLPALEPNGRTAGQTIDYGSIRIYRMEGAGLPQDGEINYVAAYVDELGGAAWNTIDFSDPQYDYQRWRQITNFEPLYDSALNLVALDMKSSIPDDKILAVVYDVKDEEGNFVYRVGDLPGTDDPSLVLDPDYPDIKYYKMKILKGVGNDKLERPYAYVLRNIYSLGGSNIDPTTFSLRIESITTGDQPQEDENHYSYLRIFGLDQGDANGLGEPDDEADYNIPYIFDLANGLLKFPLNFPQPFAASKEQYEGYVNDPDGTWEWEGTFLEQEQAPELYMVGTGSSEYHRYGKFNIVATHAAASSSFNLGVSNIEEGSETVTLDGQTLVRGTDYEIDYTFGQIELKGDKAGNLSADSKIAVNYSYAPFFGGGQTSLLGLNVGYDLGRDSKLNTTWLYQSEAIVGEKAKLGEEPAKTLVGNLNFQHVFKPYFLTHVANFLSLKNTERESSVQFSGEVAMSLPNPNTKNQVYLEDFEGVDDSNVISLSRIGWSWASAPAQNISGRTFTPEDRVENLRWFLPKERVERWFLNPDLINQERTETQQALDLYLSKNGDEPWEANDWGGIMRGISRTGLNLRKTQFIEFWVNDGVPEITERTGKLHLDFGFINEDGFWPVDSETGDLTVGKWEQEDGILEAPPTPDFVWQGVEDVGLNYQHPEGDPDGLQDFSNEYGDASDPFPKINGTAGNNREDTEDLNGNSRLDTDDGYFTTTVDLRETEALVDVVYDYDDVDGLISEGHAWRKYRIRITGVDSVSSGTSANLEAITHVRIWYEDDSLAAKNKVHLQISELNFLGSRWEREGIRKTSDESILTAAERLPGESFFLGEVNNKENPDYYPPFHVHEVNNIPEKEQSLVMDFENLEQGHMLLSSKQVSPRGDDYTGYRDLSWYWNNPSHNTADLDLFFRVGIDTLNYYEVSYNFGESAQKTGWQYMSVGLAELSNVKNNPMDENGVIQGVIHDSRTSDEYKVRIVGRPDLRTVKRYYFGVKNNNLSGSVSGKFYMNDVKLEGVKKDMGFAKRAGMRLNMADVIKLDFDWSHRDAEYHGLDKRVGSGTNAGDWNIGTSINVDDFIPLAGFRLPINASRRQQIIRPKYEMNSDIEIIDEDIRNAQSTIETQERFSSRLSHSPSKAAILRYLVDPWTVSLNGSRSSSTRPLSTADSKTLQGQLNFDLRIAGKYSLGDYPVLKFIPLVNAFSVVPSKISFGANFNSTYRASSTIDNEGNELQRPVQVSRPGKLTASIDYNPLSILSLSANSNSDRDLLREYKKSGVNIGLENKRNYDLRMTIKPPSIKTLPKNKFMYPVRQVVKGLEKLRPSIQFTGSFQDMHDPSLQLPDDPDGIRNLSNSGNWDFRLSLPIGDLTKSLFPEKKFSQKQKDRMIENQRREEQKNRRRNSKASTSPEQSGETSTPAEVDDENLTPEERLRREEERLLEAAERSMEEDRDRGLTVPDADTPQDDNPDVSSGGGFNIPNPLSPVLSVMRNIQPIKATFTQRKNRFYGRSTIGADFWFKTGLASEFDIPDSSYSTGIWDVRESISLSTTTKINRNLSVDFKFNKTVSEKEQANSLSKNFKQDWPDASLSLVGMEKWKILGGGGDSPDAGLFRNANFNYSFKQTRSVNNMTETSHNPKVTITHNPRLSMTLKNGLVTTLTCNIGSDTKNSNGVLTETKNLRVSIQVRHQFKAQAFLAKVGLYRPGSNPTISMDVDLSFQNDKIQRTNPGGDASAPTGQQRIGFNPRFSYQISRSLSGSLRFMFSRNKNIATDQTTTSLGLGLEATFVF